MRIIEADDESALGHLLVRERGADRAFERRVASIVDRVRDEGESAVVRFAKRFDGASPPFEVSPDEMRRGASRVTPEVRRAIRRAAGNIARVAVRQVPKRFTVQTAPGVVVEQRVEALARVGYYVPGGRFPL